MNDTTKKSDMYNKLDMLNSRDIKDDIIIQGEQMYIKIADTVDRWFATAFFVLQSMNPGII